METGETGEIPDQNVKVVRVENLPIDKMDCKEKSLRLEMTGETNKLVNNEKHILADQQ
jgi:hypothetical protein